jgi:SAM-dependent methyltransferase
MVEDAWLERWLPRLRSPVLELACDSGVDTAWLVQHGFDVVATDLREAAVRGALFVRHDLREPMSFSDAAFGTVIASLCLHYFEWKTTAAAVNEIRRVLAPGGLFLCRVNSDRDFEHGAGQGEEIEPGFYRQHARYAETKRFFSASDLDRLFGNNWHELSREEVTIHRYSRPKVAWELALAKGN